MLATAPIVIVIRLSRDAILVLPLLDNRDLSIGLLRRERGSSSTRSSLDDSLLLRLGEPNGRRPKGLEGLSIWQRYRASSASSRAIAFLASVIPAYSLDLGFGDEVELRRVRIDLFERSSGRVEGG